MKNQTIINSLMYILLLCAGALFGFFYTMSISIMPGLDLTTPYSAIVANQEIGHATQNYYFATTMIGTPVLLLVLSIYFYFKRQNKAMGKLLGIALLSFLAMIAVTLTLNVPLNQILDGVTITPDQPNLKAIWDAYSIDWQVYNWLRTLFSGLTLLFIGIALKRI